MSEVFYIEKTRLLNGDSLPAEYRKLDKLTQLIDVFPVIKIGVLIIADDPSASGTCFFNVLTVLMV